MLKEFGADIDVISPDLCTELDEMARQRTVRTHRRPYRRGDLESAVVVIAATDDSVANEQVADEAHERGILVNVVDVPRLSSFVVPSYVRRGALTLAVSTSGKSPALARKIKTGLQDVFGPEYGELVDMVAEVRLELKASGTEVPHDDWQEALDLDTLLGLLRAGRHEQDRQELLDRLGRDS
jgi:siroheme synthase-like protein